jgi:hypothetical protein
MSHIPFASNCGASLELDGANRLDQLGDLTFGVVEAGGGRAKWLTPKDGTRPPVASSSDDALAPGVDGGLGAVGDVQLAQNVVDVALDGALRDDQPLGDLRVAEAIGDQP